MKKNNLSWIKGIIGILVYFTIITIKDAPFILLKINMGALPSFIKYGYTILIETIIIVIILFLFKDYINRTWKDIKKNHKEHFKKYLKYWFILLGVMILSNLIILLLSGVDFSNGAEAIPIAKNEEVIRTMLSQAPVFVYILSVIFAPIIEELVFRLSIRAVIKNNVLFVLVSGLIFGSMHVLLANPQTIIDYLYIIPYSIPGIIFAYSLVKSDNIFVPIGIHFLHNGVLISIQILALLMQNIL